jgi:tRNA U38,U39,U40 pseudouridine synthase TruA
LPHSYKKRVVSTLAPIIRHISTYEVKKRFKAFAFTFNLYRYDVILGNYVGTNNHHNYTVRVDPSEPSAMRYIISFDCSEPFTVDGGGFITCFHASAFSSLPA